MPTPREPIRRESQPEKVSVMLIRSTILSAIVALIALGGAPSANAQGVFTLSSTGFKDGERLPSKFAGNNKSNPNCVGENVSPALSWANPPEGTKSYALLMFDTDGRPPGGVSHWVAYGIPLSVTGLAEGEAAKPNQKYVGGQGSMKLPTYVGPCTPPGPPHHYIFTLMATDLEPNAFKEGMTREELLKALDGHAKAATSQQ
jgi:Raf kinase inhibitor-like YbhB/YbcL family protein